MKNICFLAIIAAFLIVNQAYATDTTDAWRASINALGPTQIGMSTNDISNYTGELEKQHGDGEGCAYYSPVNGEKDVSFMLYEGKLVRIDVYSRKTETLSGLRVGDSRDHILQMYNNAVQRVNENEDHGELIYLASAKPEYKNYRMVFEVNNNIVTDYRLGLLPYVNWQKGCAGER